MILIADSGSTKTSWVYSKKGEKPDYFITTGINPFFRTSKDIFDELNNFKIQKRCEEVDSVYFYGAGIIGNEKANIVKTALLQLFPEAQIVVQSDLIAAAHSTLKKDNGIVCILGTGSNSCFYDGESITQNVPPLGFILGDEGSGAVIGKKLLSDYLKGITPADIAEKFLSEFKFNYAEFMERIYKLEKPNQFLAQFVPFLFENISEKYCSNLVEHAFQEFTDRNICRYNNYSTYSIHFVGSVAFYFQQQLKNVLDKNGLQIGKIVKDPLSGLLDFHLNY